MKDRKKIEKLFRLCLDLNPESTNKETTGKKPTIFFNFSGHINNGFTISIYPIGWSAFESDYICYRGSAFGWECYDTKNHGGFPVTIDYIISHLERLKEENV